MKEECKYCSGWNDYRGECMGIGMYCATQEQIAIEQMEREIREAAEIVRDEFMRKGDWYNALIDSIYGYLDQNNVHGPHYQMAVELASRIIGIETDNVDFLLRVYNCLKREGMITMRQLQKMPDIDVENIRNKVKEKPDDYKCELDLCIFAIPEKELPYSYQFPFKCGVMYECRLRDPTKWRECHRYNMGIDRLAKEIGGRHGLSGKKISISMPNPKFSQK